MRICIRCHEPKEETAFAFKVEAKGWRQSWCRPCHKLYKDEHYQLNRVKLIAKAKVNQHKYKTAQHKWLREYFKQHPCLDCGETDPVVLEFDHRENKVANISRMIGWSFQKLKEEIAKCDVRCANCHRRKTAKDFGWYTTYAGLV